MSGSFGDDDPPGTAPSREEGGAAPESVSADAAPVSSSADDTLAYQQRARLAEDRLAEVLAAYRQMKVDTEKHRERLQKNLDRRFEQRHERLLLKFIDVLDNLDRALEAAQVSYAGQPLLEGMILVRTQLLQVLRDEGLERIPVLGLPFDPHVAESVGTQPVGEVDHQGIVMKELQRGYRIKGRIARAARVMIGEYVEGYTGPASASPVEDEPVIGASVAAAEDEEPAAVDDDETGPSLEEIVARIEAQEARLNPPPAPSRPPADEESS